MSITTKSPFPGLEQCISAVREFSARAASFADTNAKLDPKIIAALEKLGLDKFYSHQAQAIDSVLSGRDTMVVTGTSSGKTLCYALPALQRCLEEPAARALMIYPTKALAQDQLRKLKALIPGGDVRIGIYDGDTPTTQRSAIRRAAHIVLTNPDMLHVGILPGHENWSKFLKSLRLIVLDEVHAYRGVFGSHVGNVLRRLLRLCEWHGARPPIVGCSATIANPLQLFGGLTGRRPTLIDEDGAPSAERTYVFYNPPLEEDGNRASANFTSAGLMVGLAETGMRVMTFCRARSTAELVLRYARERARAGGIVAPDRIESYRAGYTPEERRKIEKALFEGELMGLVTTSAMEMGVDVGGLDAVILNGYPGSVTSFWQQSGRAGRSTREGLVVMVAHDDPLDQFFMREASMLLDAPHEPVSINPENRTVLEQQLRCAAFERPISPTELSAFGESAIEAAEGLDRAGDLQFRAERFFFPSYESPAPKVGIRGTDGETFTLFVENKPLGTMERWRALQHAHEGAVYLHRGSSYLVRSMDLRMQKVEVSEESLPYYTQSIVQAVIEPLVDLRESAWDAFKLRLCGLRVTENVIGYRKKTLDGDTVLEVCDLDLPPLTFETVGVRLDLPFLNPDEAAKGIAAVHAMEHALILVAPFLAGCDRGDLGSAWYGMFPGAPPSSRSSRDEGGVGVGDCGPAVFIFDRTPGGIGLCEILFESRNSWGHAAKRLLETCPCIEGCPACLLTSRCEVNNDDLNKIGGLRLLSGLTS